MKPRKRPIVRGPALAVVRMFAQAGRARRGRGR